MFAVTKMAGQATITAPDMCKTVVGPSVVPMPYPTLGMPATGMPTTLKVFIAGSPALTKASKITPSNADQPGASGGGGVVSSKVMGPIEFIMSSMKVKLEGNPAVRMTDTVKINDGNTIGMEAAPSQTKVMIMS
jgi:hypothetical protein